MKLSNIAIRNFRRLTDVSIDFGDQETLFVGPNNSGKTSATAAVRSFLGNREFKIHDFSVSKISDIDRQNVDGNTASIPTIELDLWFTIDPNSIAFGQLFALSTGLSDDFTKIGIRCILKCKDFGVLWQEFDRAFPLLEEDPSAVEAEAEQRRAKPLSHFLALEGNLKNHFGIGFESLENEGEHSTLLDVVEGKRILRSLIRVDFVDAQRNIDDESAARSNKLSEAFASYYKNNLTQADTVQEAVKVIDENNDRLTNHYKANFAPLMQTIKSLGVPSVNDRELKIVSSLSSDAALKGSTDLLYVDAGSSHHLPESYNGLGFKNLVYMAVQIDHFHRQWLHTEEDRPLCQVIFIEEPEVHLHAQVQQTFIKNMWGILKEASTIAEENPQLAITTHSSHVLEAINFSKIRYFRRCPLDDTLAESGVIFDATKVHSLENFQPDEITLESKTISSTEAMTFLEKYMRLTHCDLFFADAAILVEGSVEKLLISKMVEKSAPSLNNKYLTVLEVGGAYAHRFSGLLDFLKIPYLVITDIDSVDPAANRSKCRTDLEGAVTCNGTLAQFFTDSTIRGLAELGVDACEQSNGNRFVSYQKKTAINIDGTTRLIHGRTLEETFVYENLASFQNGDLNIGIEIPQTFDEIYKSVYDRIVGKNFQKTEFALDVLSSDIDWTVPVYIEIGLQWLERKLDFTPLITEGDDTDGI